MDIKIPSSQTPEVLWTSEDFNEVILDMRETARRVFLDSGDHKPMVFLFTTKNPQTGEPEKAILPILPEHLRDAEAKNKFARAIRQFAYAYGAVGLVFIMEAWLLRASSEKEIPEIQKWSGNFENHPSRTEYLILTAEHQRLGCWMHGAEILRKGEEDKHPTLAPWDEEMAKAVSREGRFTHLLPSVN